MALVLLLIYPFFAQIKTQTVGNTVILVTFASMQAVPVIPAECTTITIYGNY